MTTAQENHTAWLAAEIQATSQYQLEVDSTAKTNKQTNKQDTHKFDST